MLRSSLLLVSFIILSYLIGLFMDEVVDGEKINRYSEKTASVALVVLALYYAFALAAWGGGAIISFSNRWIIQSGDDPVWSLIFVAPVAIMMLTLVAYFVMDYVCKLGVLRNSMKVAAYHKRRRLAKRTNKASEHNYTRVV